MSACMMDDSPFCMPGSCSWCDGARKPTFYIQGSNPVVNSMQDDINELKAKLATAERDRDEYKAQLHTANERMQGMTSAASSAAATTVTALERIQKMEKVVDAAIAWSRGGSHAALTDEVNAWLSYKKGWS